MALLFDFKCDKGHVNERMAKPDCTHMPCLDCDGMSKKLIPAVRSKLDPLSGDFIGATDKWIRNRQQKLKQERKANSE